MSVPICVAIPVCIDGIILTILVATDGFHYF